MELALSELRHAERQNRWEIDCHFVTFESCVRGKTLSLLIDFIPARHRNQQEKRQSIYDAKLIVSKNDQAVFNSMRVVDMAYRNNLWVHVRHCLNGVEWE